MKSGLILLSFLIIYTNSLKIATLPYWTFSGFSSGSYMSAQMALAYSGSLKGVGMANGGVVYCAEGNGYLPPVL